MTRELLTACQWLVIRLGGAAYPRSSGCWDSQIHDPRSGSRMAKITGLSRLATKRRRAVTIPLRQRIFRLAIRDTWARVQRRCRW